VDVTLYSVVQASSGPLLAGGYLGLFPWVKQPGRESDYLPPTSAEVKKTGLCIHSPMSSWHIA
jgi:hypothetical protein